MACTTGIALAHFSMLINELLNKFPDIVPEEVPIIILDSKYDVCMAKNGKDSKHIRRIYRRVQFVRYGEKFKMQQIDWCGGGMKLSDIVTKNVGENYLNPKMKYIMVRIEK